MKIIQTLKPCSTGTTLHDNDDDDDHNDYNQRGTRVRSKISFCTVEHERQRETGMRQDKTEGGGNPQEEDGRGSISARAASSATSAHQACQAWASEGVCSAAAFLVPSSRRSNR